MSWEISNKKPLTIAHRGDTKTGVENTLPAIESALKMGVDGIEVDLRLTRDGHVVLFHDDDLCRLGSISGSVEEKTLEELKEIQLSAGRSIRGTIPTLEHLLDLVKDQVLLNLEIKVRSSFSWALEREIVSTLRNFRLGESVLLSSFHPLALCRIRRLGPEFARGYLFEDKLWLHRIFLPWTSPFSLNPPLSHTTETVVKAQHRRGRRVFVWTVNDEDDMKRCMDAGVDGLITDEPRRLLTLLQH